MTVVGFLLFGCGERLFSAAGPGRHTCSRHTLIDPLSVPAALSFALPAPENLSVQSVNFNHTLSWNAGANTPVGTRYVIYDNR